MNRGFKSDESYELEGIVETQTAKAYLIEFTNGKKCWVPKSQCELLGDLEEGKGMFRIKEWFVEKEKLA